MVAKSQGQPPKTRMKPVVNYRICIFCWESLDWLVAIAAIYHPHHLLRALKSWIEHTLPFFVCKKSFLCWLLHAKTPEVLTFWTPKLVVNLDVFIPVQRRKELRFHPAFHWMVEVVKFVESFLVEKRLQQKKVWINLSLLMITNIHHIISPI